MLEMMRKFIIGLMVWNLCLTVGFCMFINVQNQEKLNQQICNEELIPLEVITEEF
jgi:hypothetical protein